MNVTTLTLSSARTLIAVALLVAALALIATGSITPITGWLRGYWGVPSYGGW